jgi:hypothetical protein
MKNYLILILAALMLASCSQQQFAFRKKIAVNHSDKVTVKTQPHNTSDHTSNVEANEQITYNEPHSFLYQQEKLAPTNVSVIPDDTIRKKYKFDEEIKATDRNSLPNSLNENTSAPNAASEKSLFTYAILGFAFGLSSVFLILTAIPGLIFSILALKTKNKGSFALAILGLLLSLFWPIVITIIIITWGN